MEVCPSNVILISSAAFAGFTAATNTQIIDHTMQTVSITHINATYAMLAKMVQHDENSKLHRDLIGLRLLLSTVTSRHVNVLETLSHQRLQLSSAVRAVHQDQLCQARLLLLGCHSLSRTVLDCDTLSTFKSKLKTLLFSYTFTYNSFTLKLAA